MCNRRFLLFVMTCALLGSACATQAWADAYSFIEEMSSNPFAASGGNFSVSNATGLSPDTYNQFTWDPGTSSKYAGDPVGSLVTVYDSSKPAVRLERALPLTLGMDRNFSFGACMTIRSQDFSAPDTDYFEMTFALLSHDQTGGNRTGSMSDPADVYHNVEFAYFPNVTPWGGPTLQVLAFGDKLPGSDTTAFSNFASPDFAEGDLGGNAGGQITALPFDTPLDVDISYDAVSQIMTLAVSRIESDGSLTQLLLSSTDVIDIDLSGAEYDSGAYASNNYDRNYPFAVDSLALSSYFDHWAAATPSLYAVVEFDRMTFEAGEVIPEPATVLLLGTGILVFIRTRKD